MNRATDDMPFKNDGDLLSHPRKEPLHQRVLARTTLQLAAKTVFWEFTIQLRLRIQPYPEKIRVGANHRLASYMRQTLELDVEEENCASLGWPGSGR